MVLGEKKREALELRANVTRAIASRYAKERERLRAKLHELEERARRELGRPLEEASPT